MPKMYPLPMAKTKLSSLFTHRVKKNSSVASKPLPFLRKRRTILHNTLTHKRFVS